MTVPDEASGPPSPYYAQWCTDVQATTIDRMDRFGRWSIDIGRGTILWSKEMATIFGRPDWAEHPITIEQHVGCYHSNEQAFVRNAIRAGGAGLEIGSPDFTRRHRIVRPNGEERNIIIHGQTLCDARGTVVSISGITLDISEITSFEQDLQATAATLRDTLENMDQGLVHFDASGKVRVFNQHARAMLNLPEEALHVGASFSGLHDLLVANGSFDSLSPDALQRIDQQRLAGLPHNFEITLGNATIDLRYTPRPEGGAVCTYTDITAGRAAASAIRDSEQRFRLITDNVNDVIVLGDLKMRCIYVSPSVKAALGYKPAEIANSQPVNWLHPDDRFTVVRTMQKLLVGSHETIVTTNRYRHREGHHLWMETSIRLVCDANTGKPIGFVATLRDVTARREAEEQVRHMALTDALTGLSNRVLFQDRLERTIVHTARTGRFFAVLACDLDRFKAVNDTLGHPAGDELLQVIARRMKSALRPYDTVARLGGDEFAVVLTDLDNPCVASQLAARLIENVGLPIQIGDRKVEVGVSIGLTIASGAAVKAEELFKRADIALYEAKAAGRSTFREFSPDALARAMSQGQLSLEMKDAIRRGEFRMVYQPVMDASTGKIRSFEALMRWHHPREGDVSPSKFISLAEDNGLIVQLGGWAIQEACHEAAKWPEPLSVAVNVSSIQLRSDELELAIADALAASGLPASQLKLEVTESVLMHDADDVLVRLHRLKAKGVRIALDDFGTGYSSLSYLRRFPFDVLKIDRAFIKDIADPDAAAIVRAVVGIGERLGMTIVAEGVETPEQLELVRQEGCHQVQGFLLSPPLPPDAAFRYMVGIHCTPV